MKQKVEPFMRSLQDRICTGLEALDGTAEFQEDLWERPEGGGGRSRVINGKHIEKGGVNFSAVHGRMPEKIRQALKIPAQEFFATGVSIVLHPSNPHVPIIHMNVRYFETDSGHHWFGGGIDLTPHYIDLEDAVFFHRSLHHTCSKYNDQAYKRFKTWADNYFFIKHRNETRGIGGIFFDRLMGETLEEKEANFLFTQEVGNSFLPIYEHLFLRNKNKEFRDQHKYWQMHRRGRYVEFNLVWDKGTKFGLDTNGRTESILMSMPPMAQWTYNHNPNDHEARFTQSMLCKGIDWIRVR